VTTRESVHVLLIIVARRQDYRNTAEPVGFAKYFCHDMRESKCDVSSGGDVSLTLQAVIEISH
jgi:hypothetical protein